MRRIVTAVIVVAVLAVGGLAYAEGQPADPLLSGGFAAPPGAPSPTPGRASAPSRAASPGPSPSAPPRADSARPARNLLRGAIHGQLLVREPGTGTTRTVVFDRGKLSSVSESALRLERPDGVSVTVAVTAATSFEGTSREQLQPGAPVVVVSSGGTAERVLSRGAGGEACNARPRLCQRLRSRIGGRPVSLGQAGGGAGNISASPEGETGTF